MCANSRRIVGSIPTRFVVTLFCLMFSLSLSNAENTGAQNDTVDDGSESVRPIDQGMEPLYIMTRTFLDLVQPQSRGHILEIVNTEDLASLEYITTEYQQLAKHYIGYSACIAVGILFIVFMPLIGLCVCCCRCCGNCGGKQDPHEPRSARCQRNTCAILFGIINTVMVVGMVCAFITNDLLYEQTSSEPNVGVLPKIESNINSLENFKDATFSEIRSLIDNNVATEINRVLDNLQDAPEEAKHRLGNVTDSTLVLQSASDLAQSAMKINASLEAVNGYSTELQNLQQTLSDQLTTVKTTLQSTFELISPCTGNCNDLKSQIAQVETDANFDNVPDIKLQMANVKRVIDSDLVGLVREGHEEFESITEKVSNNTHDKIEDVRRETSKMIVDVVERTEEANKQLDETIGLNTYKAQIKSYEPQVEKYGQFIWYAGLILSCILLLITLLYYLGLLFGIFGEPPYMEASTCNRGVGANLLLAGVGFTFLFCAVLMLVCLILFMVGGFGHTEVCRHLVNIEDNEDNIIDSLISSQLNMSLNVSMHAILSKCKEDQGLFNALNLNELVNISQMLDLEQFHVRDRINELSHTVVNLSDVDIISDELRTQLNDLSDAKLDDISFTTFTDELAKDLTAVDLTQYADSITAFAETMSDGSVKTNLLNDATSLRNIETTTVNDMVEKSDSLSTSLAVLVAEVKGDDMTTSFQEYVQGVMDALDKAEKDVHINGTAIIQKFVGELANDTYDDFNSFMIGLIYKLEHEIGHCKAVYQAVDRTIDSICVSFLYPFNGFWFCIGWFLFFSIPALILALKLAGLYRKTEEYVDKSFDDPHRSYDAYNGTYPGDNIPLEDRHQQHQKPYNYAQGHPNNGYDQRHDDYPSNSRYRDYPRSYDSNYRGGGGQGRAAYPSATPPYPPHY